jgi:hypothetical protein
MLRVPAQPSVRTALSVASAAFRRGDRATTRSAIDR